MGERVTDLIFRMEQLDEGFVGSTWTESEAIHQDAQSAGEIAAQQQAAIEGTEVDHKPQPIRNRQQRVGGTILPLREREEVQAVLHEEGVRAGADAKTRVVS